MKFLNIILISSFSVCLILLITLWISLTNEIGDIPKNKDDDPSFNTAGHVYQYYQSNTKYKGERKAIRNKILYSNLKLKSIEDGWITVRFIVSNVGTTGRFRFLCIDKDYHEIKLDNNERQIILSVVRSLNDWQIGIIDSKRVDSYYHVNFKVENKKIIDVF